MKRLYRINNRVMGKYFFVLGLVVTMMSCGKDIDQFIPRASQGTSGDIDRLMSRLQADMAGDVSTTISCPCAGNQVFQIDQDLVLVIPPDFVDLITYPCPESGFYEILITVCDNKGEILVSGLPTISGGKMLESRIEMNINIQADQEEVLLAKGKEIRILVNDPDPRDRMELFYGSDNEWTQADDNPDTWDNVFSSEWFFQDSNQGTISGFGYETLSDNLGWISMEAIYDVPAGQKTSACLQLPDEFTNVNTIVFMVFDDYQSVLSMHGDPETRKFCEPFGAAPIGFNVTYVVLSEMGEDCYLFASTKTSITTGQTTYLEPRKTPYEEIKKYLNEL